MKYIFFIFLSVSTVFGQKTSDSFKWQDGNTYRSAVEYTFDDIPDNGSYSCIMSDIKGDIDILGHPGSGTYLIIERVIQAMSNKNAINMLEKNQIQVFHIETDKIVEIKRIGHRYQNRIQSRFRIHLPFNTNITIESAGGDNHIRKIRGQIELRTRGGDIELEQLSGTISAYTDGGNINANHSDGVLDLHTSGGNIHITQSRGIVNAFNSAGDLNIVELKGNIKAIINGGNINIGSIEGDTISVQINGGNLTARTLNSNLIGRINSGQISLKNIRGNISVGTSSGDIELENIYGNTICNTSIGGIHGKNIFGAIKAFTSSGNIEVEKAYDSSMKDHTIDLETSAGEITIVVPDGLPITIDAEAMDMQSPYAITSYIPMEVKILPDRIHGVGKIKNGIVQCSIKSSNGPITIKKN